MKFKEGDIVRVMGKYGSYGDEWENVHWVDAMDYTVGKQGHVKKGVEFCGARYLVEFPNGNEWWYCEDSLMCVGANPWTVNDAGDAGINHIWVNKAKGTTTVKFIDGSTITVRKSKDTPFDVYYAVASAVAEKIYGSNHAFQRIIEKNTTYQKPKEKKVPCTDIPTSYEFEIKLDPSCVESIQSGLTELQGEIKSMKVTAVKGQENE